MDKFKHKGMTLIELLIVVAIVGILAAVAGPAWNDQVLKAEEPMREMPSNGANRAGAIPC